MPLDKDALRKNASPKDTFIFRDGDNFIRILPPTLKYFTENIDFFAYRMLVHYNLGPEGSPPIPCPRTNDTKTQKHSCPICERARRLRRNPATKELAGELSARTRFIANIIDMEHPERGIQVAEFGPSVKDPIFEVAVDRDYGDILDLRVGRNFKVTLTPANRSKTGYNSYSVLAGANPSSVKEILDDKKIFPKGWKNKIDALKDRVGEPPSAEDLERLVHAATGDAGVGESEPQAPTHARRSVAADEFVDPKGKGDSVVKQGSNGSPQDDAEPAAEAAAPDAEAAAKPAEGAPEGADACWGEEFQPSSEKCKVCNHKTSCMEKYVEG